MKNTEILCEEVEDIENKVINCNVCSDIATFYNDSDGTFLCECHMHYYFSPHSMGKYSCNACGRYRKCYIVKFYGRVWCSSCYDRYTGKYVIPMG